MCPCRSAENIDHRVVTNNRDIAIYNVSWLCYSDLVIPLDGAESAKMNMSVCKVDVLLVGKKPFGDRRPPT